MGGGVSPFEWILPPLAMSHHIYNAVANPIEAEIGKDVKIDTPGSMSDKQDEAEDEAQMAVEEQFRQANAAQAEEARVEGLRNPSPAAIEDARRRARSSASHNLGLGKRRSASQTLTEYSGALGV